MAMKEDPEHSSVLSLGLFRLITQISPEVFPVVVYEFFILKRTSQSHMADRQRWRCKRRPQTLHTAHVDLGQAVSFVSRRRDPINPPILQILHAVSADALVIPVADEHRAVRGDAHVRRAEEGILA